mmetsp:Transcript_2498/g.2124  ORF Transcript_2498/g.2124 Transcript_2498/m.2124 type:complete len:86 (-) Transcript_2498:835-1092(-)
MSSEAEQKYASYDWSQNSEWINHLGNFFPTPSGSKLEKIKRKWYNKNIDSSLEVNVPSSNEQQSSSSSNNNNDSSSSSAYQRPQA